MIKNTLKQHFKLNKKNVLLWMFSVITSGIFVLTKSVYHVAKLREGSLSSIPLRLFSVENILIFIVLLFLIKFLVTLLYDKLTNRKSQYKKFLSSKKVFWGTFILAMIVWGICFLTFFPGMGMNDTLTGATSFVNNSLHPTFYLIVIFFFVRIVGGLIGSSIFGFGLMTALQIVVCAFITAYVMCWLYQKKVSKPFWYISVIFLTCFPIIICYVNTILKDTWFAYGILLLLPNLYDYIFDNKHQKKTTLLLFAALALIALSRSNGLIIAIIVLVVLFIIKLKSTKKYLIPVSAGVLLLSLGMSAIVNAQHLSSSAFRESMSVPLDQVGAIFYYHGNMNEEEKSFFTTLLPEEGWIENFRFSFVDKIKFNLNESILNEQKGDFLKYWAAVALKNPQIVTRAYLYQTFGVWNLSFWDSTLYKDNQSTFYSLANNIDMANDTTGFATFLRSINLHNKCLGSGDICLITTSFYVWVFESSMFISPGLIMLLILLTSIFLIIRKKSKIIVVFLPLILAWLTMMASTPASLLYRYYLFLILSIPFILYILLYKIRGKTNH